VHAADEPVPDRAQLVKVPVPVLPIETVPVGVTGVPGAVSVTVTVQTMLPLTFEQFTVVEDVRFPTVGLVVPELPR